MISVNRNSISLSLLPACDWRAVSRAALKVMPILLLAVFLVGSCKTAMTPGALGANTDALSFRLALFPDTPADAQQKPEEYAPARGYVTTATRYIAGDVQALSRLSRSDIRHIFGAPSFSWVQDKAEMWQYHTNDCVLDVYFYGADTGESVSHYEIRPRITPRPDDIAFGTKVATTLGKSGVRSCIRAISGSRINTADIVVTGDKG